MGFYRVHRVGWRYFAGIPAAVGGIGAFIWMFMPPPGNEIAQGSFMVFNLMVALPLCSAALVIFLDGGAVRFRPERYLEPYPRFALLFKELFTEIGRLRGFRGTLLYYRRDEGEGDFSRISLSTAARDLKLFWGTCLTLGTILGMLGIVLTSFFLNFLVVFETRAQFSLGFVYLLFGFVLMGLSIPRYLGHAMFNFWRGPRGLRLLSVAFSLALSLIFGFAILGFRSVIQAQQSGSGTYFATILDEVLFFVFFPLGATLFGMLCTYSWLPLGDWFYEKYRLDRIVFFNVLEEDLDPGTRLDQALTGDELLSRLHVTSADFWIEDQVIGRGSFGIVYKGRLKRDIEVAVKMVSDGDEVAWSVFEKELKVWGGLAQHNGEQINFETNNRL